MDLEALPIHIGDLQGEGCMEPEAQAIHGGEGDLVVQGRGRLEEPPALLHTEDSGELVDGRRAHEREGMPSRAGGHVERRSEGHWSRGAGRWGEAIDVFAVEEGTLQLLCRDAVGALWRNGPSRRTSRT